MTKKNFENVRNEVLNRLSEAEDAQIRSEVGNCPTFGKLLSYLRDVLGWSLDQTAEIVDIGYHFKKDKRAQSADEAVARLGFHVKASHGTYELLRNWANSM